MPEIREYLACNIRRAREHLKLRQEDLAGAIGAKSGETISQIEKGTREVKAWELVEIARRLHVDMLDLLSPEGPRAAPGTLWRSVEAQDREETEANLRLRSERYRLLMELTGNCPLASLPRFADFDLHSDSVEQVEAMAETVRREMNLGERPAHTLFQTLEEDYGVMIFFQDMSEGGSALCLLDENGPAMLLNKSEAPWRRNFSCAHELFHLLTWDASFQEELGADQGLFARVESLANHFAGALLLPKRALEKAIDARSEAGEVQLTDIIQLARRFGVSTHALLVRMAKLEMISPSKPEEVLADPDFKSSDRATMSERWFTPNDLPQRFVELAFIAYKQGSISKMRLSQFLETNLADLPRTLGKYGLDLNIDVTYETTLADP